MVLKSKRYISLTISRPDWYPPKKTALCWSTMVKVKLVQGGGLSPLSSGDHQTPGVGVSNLERELYNVSMIEMNLCM